MERERERERELLMIQEVVGEKRRDRWIGRGIMALGSGWMRLSWVLGIGEVSICWESKDSRYDC